MNPHLLQDPYFIWLDTIDSTNKYATQLLSNNPAPFTVIVAENQTNGRGQGHSLWQSNPSQNMLLSIIIYPQLAVNHQFFLTKLITLAITQFLYHHTGIQTTIKWPNDIYFNDQKLAGILIENTIMGSTIKSSIIGIGLNVNQTHFDIHKNNPTSINLITHKEWDKNKLIKQLIPYVQHYFNHLQTNNFDILTHQYHKNLYKLNKPHTFYIHQKAQEGNIIGVSADGRLQVIIHGTLHTFNNKEISFSI